MVNGAGNAGREGRGRRIALTLVCAWLGLVIASNVAQYIERVWRTPQPIQGAVRGNVTVARTGAEGPIEGDQIRLSYLRFTPATRDPSKTPLLLLHGSPGRAADFRAMAPLLGADGRDVFALDLPGFGHSERPAPDYGIIAAAHAALLAMDAMGLERAHVLGWSQGGGAAMHMERLAPERVASLTLLASIGTQQAEGSGSYRFERAKHAFGFVVLVGLPELVPHFGLLGERGARVAFLRSFWDTDLRPMRRLMREIEAPTLLVHGRRDFLVPSWGAEQHYELIDHSRLVMLDTGHFLPFPGKHGAEEASAHIARFLARHDDPNAAPLSGRADFAPALTSKTSAVAGIRIARDSAWWLLVLIIILGTFISEDATVIAVGMAIAHQQIDPFVGLLGCFVGIVIGDGGLWLIGRVAGRRALRWPVLRAWVSEESLERWGRWFDRHTIQAVFIARALPGTRMPTYFAAGILSRRAHGFLLWAAIAALLWTPALLTMVIVLGPRLFEAVRSVVSGPVAVVVCVLVFLIGVHTLTGMMTWTGRRRIVRDARRVFAREFWPAWLTYLPILPWIVWQTLRRRGVMTFTSANPGVPNGGGVIGESKQQILDRLRDAGGWIIPSVLVPPGSSPEDRAYNVDRTLRERPEFGGYPAVLKPDAGQRGRGFKVVASREEATAYLRRMPRAVVLQRFHPGPHEVGVMWARVPGEPRGRIAGITRKRFPTIVGDGESTLERLIWTHPRYVMQAEVFLKRYDAKRDLVLGKGEEMALGVAGNHCQGATFFDGADLVTPELERAIDEIARSFEGGGFDFGRFDLRYSDEEALKRGEGFTVLELNGVSSEPTNMYDPEKSARWAYRTLLEHWRLLFRIGDVRRGQGVRQMTLGEMLRAVRDHYRGRPGTHVSD